MANKASERNRAIAKLRRERFAKEVCPYCGSKDTTMHEAGKIMECNSCTHLARRSDFPSLSK